MLRQWPKARRARSALPLGADEIDVEPGDLRGLSGHAWRQRRRIAPTSSCRARPIPEKPALTSIPKAACRLADRANFPPGDAREDWAIIRALSERSASGCPSIRWRSCARALRGLSASRAISTRSRRRDPQRRSATLPAAPRARAACLARSSRLLPDQPDRARLGRDGRMLGPRHRAACDGAKRRNEETEASMDFLLSAPHHPGEEPADCSSRC